jgi:ATP adenylyltransferase
MSLDQLWAPWRHGYVARATAKKEGSCFICDGLATADDAENHIVVRTPQSVVLLNRYPYNNGHLLIAPKSHKARLDELTLGEMMDGQELIRKMIAHLEKLIKPEGFNIGLNLGRTAGAGLPGHLHWHLVPRWNGDTNFMSILASTSVISQSLDSLYQMLTQSLAETDKPAS